jgi:hypothetical protein
VSRKVYKTEAIRRPLLSKTDTGQVSRNVNCKVSRKVNKTEAIRRQLLSKTDTGQVSRKVVPQSVQNGGQPKAIAIQN